MKPDLQSLETVMQRCDIHLAGLTTEQVKEERRTMRKALRNAGIKEVTIKGPRDFRYPTEQVDAFLKTLIKTAA